MIDAQDAAFANLMVWQDLNHDGVSDAGELKSLADLGIASINLATAGSNAFIDGQAILGEGSFTYADGSTGSFVEVDFDAALGNTEAANDDEYDDGLDAEHEADNRATANNAAALAASVGFGVATAAASAVAADPLHADDASVALSGDGTAPASGLAADGPDGSEAPVIDPLHGTPGDETTHDDGGSTGSDAPDAHSLAPVDSEATPSPIESLAAAPAGQRRSANNTTIITPDGQPAHAEAASTADHQSVPSSGAAFEELKAEPLPEVKSLVDHDATATTPVAAALHASLAERLATLSALDTNHDGLVDANDANFNQLTVWQDANHDGVADANELSSLADHGINGISLNGVSIEGYLDAQSLLAQTASGAALVAVQGVGRSARQAGQPRFRRPADRRRSLSRSRPGAEGQPAHRLSVRGCERERAGSLRSSARRVVVGSGAAACRCASAVRRTRARPKARRARRRSRLRRRARRRNANDGPAEAAGPNHAEAAAVTIHVDDGAEQAQNHAVA